MKNKPQQTPKTKKQFLDFFSKIPTDKWTTCGNYHTVDRRRSCAIGHAKNSFGHTIQVEAKLESLQANGLRLVEVNDQRSVSFPQRSAKERVLAFIKATM